MPAARAPAAIQPPPTLTPTHPPTATLTAQRLQHVFQRGQGAQLAGRRHHTDFLGRRRHEVRQQLIPGLQGGGQGMAQQVASQQVASQRRLAGTGQHSRQPNRTNGSSRRTAGTSKRAILVMSRVAYVGRREGGEGEQCCSLSASRSHTAAAAMHASLRLPPPAPPAHLQGHTVRGVAQQHPQGGGANVLLLVVCGEGARQVCGRLVRRRATGGTELHWTAAARVSKLHRQALHACTAPPCMRTCAPPRPSFRAHPARAKPLAAANGLAPAAAHRVLGHHSGHEAAFL